MTKNGLIEKYKVHRKNKPDCIVSIMYDRNTNKYCFVNLTSGHVCSCRFNSVDEAIEDLNNRSEVISYEKMID